MEPALVGEWLGFDKVAFENEVGSEVCNDGCVMVNGLHSLKSRYTNSLTRNGWRRAGTVAALRTFLPRSVHATDRIRTIFAIAAMAAGLRLNGEKSEDIMPRLE